jgi:hypothetical protein
MPEFLKVFDELHLDFAIIRVANITHISKFIDEYGDVKYKASLECNNYYIIDKRCQSSYDYVSDVFDGKSDDFLEVSVINTHEKMVVSKNEFKSIHRSVDNDGVVVFYAYHRYVNSTEIRPTNTKSYEYIKSLGL